MSSAAGRAEAQTVEAEAQTVQVDVDFQALGAMSLDELLGLEIRAPAMLAQTASEAPSVVSVVTREQIHGYGWITLNDVLYSQPGFAPSRDYDRRTVSSRGMFEGWNNNHLLLLIDGVPYNDNLYGTAYTSELTPLVFTRSVEVIRGPGSALYGSNATNGVVSMNTLSAQEYAGRGLARVRIGSQGHRIFDAVTAAAGEHLGLVLAFQHFGTDGYDHQSVDGSGRADASGDLARFRVRDQRTSNYLFGKVEGYGALEGLQLQVHYQAWDFQTGHGWLFIAPDFAESMNESRVITTLSYRRTTRRISQFHAARFQRHSIDWNMRYFPDGSVIDSTAVPPLEYANGLWERLATNGDDVFVKSQVTVHLPRQASLLFGLESDVFWYRGDRAHYSNVDINSDGTFEPFPGGEQRPLDSWLEWVEGLPIVNLAAYGQFVSGDLFSRYLTVTAGARYDLVSVRHRRAIDGSTDAVDSRLFQQVSPRLGLVSRVTDRVHLKLLAARAFRAPTPTELAGANTYSLASNITELEPEVITTVDLASDFRITEGLVWRANAYITRFENQIAYSPTNFNLSTNIYTLNTVGAETELYFQSGPVSGFLNYTYAHRLGETILDPAVSQHDGRLTWAPAHVANLATRYQDHGFTGAVQLHFQGPVARRDSDVDAIEELYGPSALGLRPDRVRAWLGLDLRVAYAPAEWIEVGVLINNALDGLFGSGGNRLIKNFAYPFDYRADGRRVLGTLTLRI